MLDKQYIGHVFKPIKVPVELGRLKFFAKSIGENNPIYFDVDAAQKAGYRSVIAPPTFTMVIDSEYESESMPEFDLMGIDIGRILHANQSFEYFLPICAGDEIFATRRIKNITEKKAGTLEFVEIDSEYHNQEGELVATSLMTFVYRN